MLGGGGRWLTCVHRGAAAGSGGKGTAEDKDGGQGRRVWWRRWGGWCARRVGGGTVGIACRSPMRLAESGQWLARQRSPGSFKGALAFLGIVLANRSRGRKRRGSGGEDDTGSSLRLLLPPPRSPAPPPPAAAWRAARGLKVKGETLIGHRSPGTSQKNRSPPTQPWRTQAQRLGSCATGAGGAPPEGSQTRDAPSAIT